MLMLLQTRRPFSSTVKINGAMKLGKFYLFGFMYGPFDIGCMHFASCESVARYTTIIVLFACRRRDRVLRYNLSVYTVRTQNQSEYSGPVFDCKGGQISDDW